MSTPAKIAAALLLAAVAVIAVLVALLQDEPDARAAANPGAAVAAPEANTPVANLDRLPARAEHAPPAQPRVDHDGVVAPAATQPREHDDCGRVEVRATWAQSGEPARDVLLCVIDADFWHDPSTALAARTDSEGVARWDSVPPGRFAVEAELDGTRVLGDVAATQSVRLELALAEHCSIAGVVTDSSGRAVQEAEVRRISSSGCGPRDELVATCDHRGRFEVHSLQSGHLYARARDHAPSPLLVLPPCKPRQRHELELRLGQAGAVLGVQVLDQRDQPLAGAAVRVWADANAALSTRMPPQRVPVWLERTDDEGRVLLRGLGSGTHSLTAHAPGFVAAWTSLDLGVGARREEIVRLDAGGRVSGRVQAPSGTGAKGVVVTAGDACAFHFARTRTFADGSFRLTGLPPGRHTLRATAGEGLDAEASLEVRAGETIEWNPRLD